MSREIKFRIWEEKIRLRSRNEILNRYSDYTNKTSDGIEYSYEFSPLTGQVICEIEYDEPYSELTGERTGARWNATGDVVLEQYTGLRDKNGKEIYEGDIISCYSLSGEYGALFVVKYGELPDIRGHEYCPCLQGFYLDEIDEYEEVDEDGYMEVIGNIHENPELLEVE